MQERTIEEDEACIEVSALEIFTRDVASDFQTVAALRPEVRRNIWRKRAEAAWECGHEFQQARPAAFADPEEPQTIPPTNEGRDVAP